MLPHSAIYIEYIAALPFFIVQLVGITIGCIGEFTSRTLRSSIRILHRRIFGNIKFRNSRIGRNIKNIRCNILRAVKVTLNRGSIRKTFKINTTVNVIRNTASNTLTISARSERTGSNATGIDQAFFRVHSLAINVQGKAYN